MDEPDNIAQVKIGTKDQEDQEVLLFLGALAFAALDHVAGKRTAYCMAVIPSSRQSRYWRRLQPMAERMKLTLSPSTASEATGRGSQWIDPVSAEIRPYARSRYSKIFGAGTNAKFVGLFRRAGTAIIDSEVTSAGCGHYMFLLYRVSEVSFVGEGELLSWWP